MHPRMCHWLVAETVPRKAGVEICDPPAEGTCSAEYKSLLQCGNAIIDPGEECDDGQDGSGADKDCRADCVINPCGDGFVNSNGVHNHEDCDAAPPAPANDRRAFPVETASAISPVRRRAAVTISSFSTLHRQAPPA